MGKSNVLIDGPVTTTSIAYLIAKHNTKQNLGAHSIFIGQVRADIINEKPVIGIYYSAYEEMAEKKFAAIREKSFDKYQLSCMHLIHSKGLVKAGEISLFVMISSAHRTDVFKTLEEIVEEIKSDVPIWGMEMFDDETHVWKSNS